MKDADAFVKKISDLQDYLRSELIWAQAKQEEQANARRRPAPQLKVGDKVMLDRRFITTKRPNQSLDHKNLGPYTIKREINNTAYELDLPETMNQIFPVFHPWLLHLDEANPLPGQHNADPGPVEIAGEPEWEVDEVVDSRLEHRMKDPATGEKGLLQYRVTFKGWDTYNQTPQWERYDQLENAADAVADFHHLYPSKPGPHSTFQRPADWEPPLPVG